MNRCLDMAPCAVKILILERKKITERSNRKRYIKSKNVEIDFGFNENSC